MFQKSDKPLKTEVSFCILKSSLGVLGFSRKKLGFSFEDWDLCLSTVVSLEDRVIPSMVPATRNHCKWQSNWNYCGNFYDFFLLLLSWRGGGGRDNSNNRFFHIWSRKIFQILRHNVAMCTTMFGQTNIQTPITGHTKSWQDKTRRIGVGVWISYCNNFPPCEQQSYLVEMIVSF